MLIEVSPRFTLNTCDHTVTELLSLKGDQKCIHSFSDANLHVAIFRDRMTGWFFDPAIKLLNEGHDVAAVHIVTPLIEALEERYKGESSRGNSFTFFKDRASEIFQLDNEDALKLLYAGLRCGFAHHGFLKDDENRYNILFKLGLGKPLEYRIEHPNPILYVDSRQYVEQIRDAYEEYYAQLESDSDLRDRFKKIWNKDWQMSLRVPGGAGTVVNQ